MFSAAVAAAPANGRRVARAVEAIASSDNEVPNSANAVRSGGIGAVRFASAGTVGSTGFVVLDSPERITDDSAALSSPDPVSLLLPDFVVSVSKNESGSSGNSCDFEQREQTNAVRCNALPHE